MSARQFAAWVAVFFFAVMFKFVSASPDKPGGPQAPQPVALADLEPTAAIAPAPASAPAPPADKPTALPSQATSAALVRGRTRRADRADEPPTILRHRPPRHDGRGTPLRKHERL
jgi:hypothetical protein